MHTSWILEFTWFTRATTGQIWDFLDFHQKMCTTSSWPSSSLSFISEREIIQRYNRCSTCHFLFRMIGPWNFVGSIICLIHRWDIREEIVSNFCLFCVGYIPVSLLGLFRKYSSLLGSRSPGIFAISDLDRFMPFVQSVPVAPFILNYSGALFRQYPGLSMCSWVFVSDNLRLPLIGNVLREANLGGFEEDSKTDLVVEFWCWHDSFYARALASNA
jgi:hypothetical protein